jgi:hypothetical protein
LNVIVIKQLREIFVIYVLTRQKYVADVSSRKVFLNLKRIKKVFVVKYQEGVSVESVVSGNDPYPKRQEKNLKKQIHSHP